MAFNKIAVVAFSLGITAYLLSTLNIEVEESKNDKFLFTEFVAKFNKNLMDVNEFEKRFETFKDNLRHMEAHNEIHGFKLGINMFSDLSEDEFLDIYANKETEQ